MNALPITDNRVQIEIAKLAFKREHPEVAAPSNNEIMRAWLPYAPDYRKMIELRRSEVVDPNDEETLAELYMRVRSAHDSAGGAGLR